MTDDTTLILPGEAWQASSWGCKESDTTEVTEHILHSQ